MHRSPTKEAPGGWQYTSIPLAVIVLRICVVIVLLGVGARQDGLSSDSLITLRITCSDPVHDGSPPQYCTFLAFHVATLQCGEKQVGSCICVILSGDEG